VRVEIEDLTAEAVRVADIVRVHACKVGAAREATRRFEGGHQAVPAEEYAKA
jgi:hypothetical protein